ncbi:external alternative NAD(P)H-ubiquinone oxidoreductase B1, mitochondrial-like isoform X2 [Olea europaea var. sylvestris]|uniref:external alternative NAD(P)H-ubiquinone oxidoreductase B1, mitochondrial-like isoform X2 n=1 Tax=Olea europaea var. sylvestris TaxID=158386 RepID=UPI000C1D107F|nr:external alternative NAD(P)H-ubiquinone oxidoreductase B1, mitochondrial-like isoform X2 [Olea europaea var. sylvestris]
MRSSLVSLISCILPPLKLNSTGCYSSGGLIACADSPSEGGKSIVKLNQKVVSPRNYFAFTPLLSSVTCGTVEARSIVEPVRNIIKRNGEINFWEAECLRIDQANRKVFCRSTIDENLAGNNEFSLQYDYLILAIGAQVNIFNTSGVLEHCHFLKEVEDAQKIRRTVIDCFEKAVLPGLTKEERKTHIHFVVVGGGPTGIEFAAELHDFVHEDLVNIYPSVKDSVNITVIQSGDHILNSFDERISSFAERKFRRNGIQVLTGHCVLSVSDRLINMKNKATRNDDSMPHGMVVWSTGVGTRPVVKDFMEQVGHVCFMFLLHILRPMYICCCCYCV